MPHRAAHRRSRLPPVRDGGILPSLLACSTWRCAPALGRSVFSGSIPARPANSGHHGCAVALLEGFANLAALAIERARLAEQASQAQVLAEHRATAVRLAEHHLSRAAYAAGLDHRRARARWSNRRQTPPESGDPQQPPGASWSRQPMRKPAA